MLARFSALLTESERTQLVELRRLQPGLSTRCVDDRAVFLGGRLSLVDDDGVEADAYAVEIAIPRDFPASMPTVVERGGRIPRIHDRHITETDGSCCIEFPVEFFLRGTQSIAEYVNGAVRSYFIAQSYFEQFGSWPHGQLAHGTAGVQQFCVERLGVADLAVISKMLRIVPRWRAFKNARCPCGSGRKLLKCHRDTLRVLRRWPPSARDVLARLSMRR